MYSGLVAPTHTTAPRWSRKWLVAANAQLLALLFLLGAFIFPRGQFLLNGGVTTASSSQVPASAMLPFGRQIDDATLAQRLPPPPLDALPYEVRTPLSNGPDVVAKMRWLWVPDGQAITIAPAADGQINVTVPDGTKWWKEFYVKTDRGAFLVERRIVLKVPTRVDPSGWQLFTAYYLPDAAARTDEVSVASGSEAANEFYFEATEAMPPQSHAKAVRVHFQGPDGETYPYMLPGQNMCLACHNGASGAYPQGATDPILAFGLHPNNLTPASLAALEARSWLTGSAHLLNADYPLGQKPVVSTLEALTPQVVAVLRNNCASCHNASPLALGHGTAFVLDPNRAYTTAELLAVLAVPGKMMGAATQPLVVPGDPDHSEIMLRLQGLEARRRMPPLEGGLPEPEAHVIELLRAWILAAAPSE